MTGTRNVDDNVFFTPAAELAQLIARREISTVELTKATLARIEDSQASINAFITTAADTALAAAEAAEAKVLTGDPLPPLHGVPFSVKDLVNTSGVRTTFGSHHLADNIPAADSICVARMKAAGAIMIGKTTTPEFGHKPLTEAPLFGKTRNPWNLSATAGGSSGGAAAAVAAGLGPLAIGTDGGGSIRIPAACSGVVGMKPTLGCIPHDQSADAFGSLVYFGPMTRTVLDAALMLDAMAGPASCDPYATQPMSNDFTAEAGNPSDLQGLRIAWAPLLGNEAIDSETLDLCEKAARQLQALGATVDPLGDDFANTEWLWLTITHSIWASRFKSFADRDRGCMDPSLLTQMDRGSAYTAVDLQDAQRARTELFRQVQGWFERFDLIAMPTLSRPAVSVDQNPLGDVDIAGRAAGSLRGAWYPYTHPFNLTGHPAITVPCGFTADGLPVGLQLVARWYGEAQLIRAASRYEAACDWMSRRPEFATVATS